MSPLERFLREEDTLREIARIRHTAREQAARQTLLELKAWAPSFKDPAPLYWLGRLATSARHVMALATRWRRA